MVDAISIDSSKEDGPSQYRDIDTDWISSSHGSAKGVNETDQCDDSTPGQIGL